ncbi:nose resistant to fluoxetine protein 6-like [Episyrphus balteatus]|uniref:nose resistant to fluoxetine protein 6-like n=1 Tax=Episyrphus balteatus TaxID=286459 RepID=UPI0024862A21|nr:nose resistant to fluoxetine protein 6-like [Episyrphus balteatus]
MLKILKTPLLFLIIFNCLLLPAQSLSLENLTVSSNFIQNLFMDEVRNNLKLLDMDMGDIVNGSKCILQLQELSKFSQETFKFLDSWGKFPTGIMSGHLIDFGSYDQCVEISTVLIPSHGVTNGKYCFASFPDLLKSLMNSDMDSKEEPSDVEEYQIFGKAFEKTFNLQIGICIPEICTPEFIIQILQKSMTFTGLSGLLPEINISDCSVAKKPDFRTIDIIAITFFSFIGVLMLLSTLYDLVTAHFRRKPVPLLISFSVITNAEKLFMIDIEKSQNTITCLPGIRALSMFWIIYGHNYYHYFKLNMINMSYALEWSNSFHCMGVLMGTILVDSFFFLSGLLVAWIGFKELDTNKGNLNIVSKYRHRYIRLTPALAALVLYYITLNNYIGNGPLRSTSKGCDKNWWLTLLYVQNYDHSEKLSQVCVPQAWYLACDFQLYILSPLVLIPLWKWGKKFIPVIVVLAVLSIGCVIATYYVKGYTNVIGLGNPIGNVPPIYSRTHARYTPWLVGIVLGYFMYTNRNKTFQIPVIVQLIGWIVSLGTMFFTIFGPHFFLEFPYDSTVGIAGATESLKHVVWALALSWIVFVCHFGYGGLVNYFLSHPFWQPLERLTYCMYLVHMAVQEINYNTSRTDVYFSAYTMLLQLWTTLGSTILAAIVLVLSFEAPALAVDKAIFGKKKPKIDRGDD